jgi:hypothetical protein
MTTKAMMTELLDDLREERRRIIRGEADNDTIEVFDRAFDLIAAHAKAGWRVTPLENIFNGLWRNAEDEVIELAKVLQTIATEPVNWNTTDLHYYAGIVGRFQLLADKALNATPPTTDHMEKDDDYAGQTLAGEPFIDDDHGEPWEQLPDALPSPQGDAGDDDEPHPGGPGFWPSPDLAGVKADVVEGGLSRRSALNCEPGHGTKKPAHGLNPPNSDLSNTYPYTIPGHPGPEYFAGLPEKYQNNTLPIAAQPGGEECPYCRASLTTDPSIEDVMYDLRTSGEGKKNKKPKPDATWRMTDDPGEVLEIYGWPLQEKDDGDKGA